MSAELKIDRVDEVLTMNPELGEGALGRLEHVSVVFDQGRLVYLGAPEQAPEARRVVDGRGCVALPGLVDCHTHALFGGSRAQEFQRRLAGVPYSEILEAGGGILSTVRQTRAASDQELRDSLRARLAGFLASGVTTVEVKTGYALSVEQELRCLRLMEGEQPTRVLRTFLGAHTVPAEWRPDRVGYRDHLIQHMLPEVAGHAEFIDVYCDRGAFTLEDTRLILEAGMALGLKGRVHAEQVQYTGAAALAAELGCSSADHLEQLDPAGVAALAASDTVGVLLPGAQLYLRDPAPPARALIEAGGTVAVATDFNPGTSPVRELLACATLACINMGLSVEEALLGITRHAGLALGHPELGWLGEGAVADLALFRPPAGEPAHHSSLVQYLGGHRARAVVREGRLVFGGGALEKAPALG